jgi:hypothetical protein
MIFWPIWDSRIDGASDKMPKNIRNVMVRGANGTERQLVLLRISGETAYVCAPARYFEAVENPNSAVGFPKEDVRLLEAAN